MAKRLTDTDKWKDGWYLGLSNDYRIIWQYILDNCGHAGIFKKGFTLMNFCCHTTITEMEFNTVFTGRAIDCGEFYFIPRFITFQYTDLKSNKPVVISVLRELERCGLLEMVSESLPNDYLTIKSKSTSKRTSKSKSMEEPFQPMPKETREAIDKLLGKK